MKDTTQKSTQNVLESFDDSQEIMERMAFDMLNLADRIGNYAKVAGDAFLVLEKNNAEEEKKQAVSAVRECLKNINSLSSELSEKVHNSEKKLANQKDYIEQIKQIIDFLYCPWE